MVPRFSVLLPASLVADSLKLREKTVKVGLIGRALAIFQVEKVCIYNDDDEHVKKQSVEAELMASLLRYMETPQYLRKLIFPHTKELRYVGLLPPLRTPHHPLRDERAETGDCREAVVVESGERGSVLELGLLQQGVTDERLEKGSRLPIRLGELVNKTQRKVTPIKRDEIDEYWGFEVDCAKNLSNGLNMLKSDYIVGTSRRGESLYGAIAGIKKNSPGSVAVAFGGPYQGLYEICERQGVEPGEKFDVVVNTVPRQGTATVRTEEALLASLALIGMLLEGK